MIGAYRSTVALRRVPRGAALGLFVAVLAAPADGRILAPAETWDEARAAHLLRRAGFGGTPEEIARLAAMGVGPAVDALVDDADIPDTLPAFVPVQSPDRRATYAAMQALDEDSRRQVRQRLHQLDRLQVEELRAWWLRRMVITPRPFEEKMTLFWHGHFTSGHREVKNSTMLYAQNELLRTHALGSYRTLLVAISQDPAMLRYLDNASNRKRAPNENYARELLELFTLGAGHYTETDIKEAARALTGWTLRGNEFVEAWGMHDRGEKTFLGHTGNFDGTDIIDIILAQPAAAEHLARRLLIFFVIDVPAPELVEDFAAVIRAHDFDLRESMRTLFKSEAFFDPAVMHAKIKSPVELVVGTLRLLEVEPRDLRALTAATSAMGQELFQPPNVKGWDGGRKWINTATLFARYNFASGVLAGTQSREAARLMSAGQQRPMRAGRRDRHRDALRAALADLPGLVIPESQISSTAQPPFDPTDIVLRERLFTVDKVLNHFVARVLPMDVDPAQRKRLRALLTAGGAKFDPRNAEGKRHIVSLLNALLAMPEYQVN